MKLGLKLVVFSLVFLGVIGLIHAKADPAQLLFSPKVVGSNTFQSFSNVNQQQFFTLLQQQGFSNGGSSGLTDGTVPVIMHRASGNFHTGGTIILDIIGDPSMMNYPFALVFSLTGDYPGLNFPGIGVIPANPPYLYTIFGYLDHTGQAQVSLTIPHNLRLVGLPLTSVAAVMNPSSQQIFISNPVSYTVSYGIQGTSCCTEGVLGGPESQCIPGGVSFDYCRLTLGGAIQQCIPFETRTDPPPGAPVNLTIATVNNTLLTNLTENVANSNISSRVYNATTYDCDDFADDLEQWLQGLGYDATYTYFIKYKDNVGTPDYAHAITDVHLPDGSVIWIEPQTGKIIDIDFDGDGKVGANYNQNPYKRGYYPTDDNAKISVYDSAAAATAAGAPRD